MNLKQCLYSCKRLVCATEYGAWSSHGLREVAIYSPRTGSPSILQLLKLKDQGFDHFTLFKNLSNSSRDAKIVKELFLGDLVSVF